MSIQSLTIYPAIKLSKLLLTLENGSRPPGGVGQVRNGIPSLGAEHISTDGKFSLANIKFIPEDFFNRMSRGIIKKHDVLVVKDGATTGKTAFVDDNFPFEKAAVNEHVFILRPDQELLLSEFLFFFLYSAWGQAQIEREFHGGAIGGINQTFADHLEIPLPPLPEQRRIVAILRQADMLCQWRRETILISKRLHAKFFAWYFGNGQAADGYKTVKLETLLKVGLSSGYSPQTNDDPSGIPVFNLSALTDYGLDEQQLKYFPAQSYYGKGSDLVVDDLLISRSNTLEFVGRVGRYTGSLPKVIYPDTMIRIRVGDHVDAIYIEHFLRSPYMRAVITQRARGTSGSMKKISQLDINGFDVLLPKRSERESFAQKIEFLEDQENKYSIAFHKTDLLYQLISTNVFTGDLTKPWCEEHKEELSLAAWRRDKALSERNAKREQVEIVVEGVNYQESLEGMRQSIGNLGVHLTMAVLGDTKLQMSTLSQSVKNLAAAIAQSLLAAPVEIIQKNLSESLQVLASSISLPAFQFPELPVIGSEAILHYIDELPVPQEKRAIIENLDTTTLRVLKLAGTYPAYFTANDLEAGEFGGITTLQAEASLRTLQALGFVKLVQMDGLLRYRLTDEHDYANLPSSLSVQS